jgi:hypothetical protein
VNNAIIVVDTESKLNKALKSINLGLVHRLTKEIKGFVICKFVGFNAQEKENFKTKPAYISGIDVT